MRQRLLSLLCASVVIAAEPWTGPAASVLAGPDPEAPAAVWCDLAALRAQGRSIPPATLVDVPQARPALDRLEAELRRLTDLSPEAATVTDILRHGVACGLTSTRTGWSDDQGACFLVDAGAATPLISRYLGIFAPGPAQAEHWAVLDEFDILRVLQRGPLLALVDREIQDTCLARPAPATVPAHPLVWRIHFDRVAAAMGVLRDQAAERGRWPQQPTSIDANLRLDGDLRIADGCWTATTEVRVVHDERGSEPLEERLRSTGDLLRLIGVVAAIDRPAAPRCWRICTPTAVAQIGFAAPPSLVGRAIQRAYRSTTFQPTWFSGDVVAVIEPGALVPTVTCALGLVEPTDQLDAWLGTLGVPTTVVGATVAWQVTIPGVPALITLARDTDRLLITSHPDPAAVLARTSVPPEGLAALEATIDLPVVLRTWGPLLVTALREFDIAPATVTPLRWLTAPAVAQALAKLPAAERSIDRVLGHRYYWQGQLPFARSYAPHLSLYGPPEGLAGTDAQRRAWRDDYRLVARAPDGDWWVMAHSDDARRMQRPVPTTTAADLPAALANLVPLCGPAAEAQEPLPRLARSQLGAAILPLLPHLAQHLPVWRLRGTPVNQGLRLVETGLPLVAPVAGVGGLMLRDRLVDGAHIELRSRHAEAVIARQGESLGLLQRLAGPVGKRKLPDVADPAALAAAQQVDVALPPELRLLAAARLSGWTYVGTSGRYQHLDTRRGWTLVMPLEPGWWAVVQQQRAGEVFLTDAEPAAANPPKPKAPQPAPAEEPAGVDHTF